VIATDKHRKTQISVCLCSSVAVNMAIDSSVA